MSERQSTIRSVQILVGSHLVFFVAGVAVGKFIDYDELSNYRSHHESTMTRFKRRAGQLGMAVVAVGTIAAIFKIATRIQNK
jgi:hypothetical protein